MDAKILFLIVLTISMTLYITQRVSVIVTALITIFLLTITNLIDLQSAFSGFSSPATIAIGAMFVLSAGLIRTGALEPLTAKLAQWSRGSYLRLMLAMGATIPFASAFINNTPVVVMMVPVVLSLGRKFNIAPSKLLMPLSFFAIMGGTCTLIGTSTNLLVDEIYYEETGVFLNIFDFTPVGLAVLVVGGLFMILFGRRLLPERESLTALLPVSRRTSYVTELIVDNHSQLIGRAVSDTFPRKGKLRFIQLIRGEDFFVGVQGESVAIQAGDALILEGSPQEIADLMQKSQVSLGTVLEDAARVPMRTLSLGMFELVVLPDSRYVGAKLRDLALHKWFGVKVLAVQRGGRHHRMDIRRMRLKAGDVLLVQGDRSGLARIKESPDLLAIEEVQREIVHKNKAPLALAVVVGVVLLTYVTAVPLVVWALAGVAVLIAGRCLNAQDAVQALDFNVLFLLIGTIPLGRAFVETKLNEDLSRLLIDVVGLNHPLMMLAALYLLTNILTSLLSNTAVAVLMTPFALGLAAQMGVEPKPLVMAVAFAASASFATPISYQTNVIVMGPAGYQFNDFVKVGVPISLLVWVVASLLIPLLWPFVPV